MCKTDKVYDLAQAYANRGFDLIKSMMYTKPDHITILEKIQELDEIYERIKI